MTVKNLADTSLDQIIGCFLAAFENYYVPMPQDKTYYKNRWKAAKVDLNFSYGMFDDGNLVGFLIHAIDKRNGFLTAYNTGTGVIPVYRKKKIVNSMYQYALKDLAKNRIERVTLEVVTKNKIAIKSYESIGFKKVKLLKCFKGPIRIERANLLELKEIEYQNINWNKLPNQQLYSWDNQKESLLEGNYHYYELLNGDEIESFFVINKDIGYLAQFDVLIKNTNAWNRLFSAIKQLSSYIKVNNVDEQLKDKLNALSSIGLKNTLDQYEMQLNLKIP